MTTRDFVIRLLTAFTLGFIIGFERQYRQGLAGIRTNVLVCIGACIFVAFPSLAGVGDKTRIAGQIITGVGFLGGGVILREGFNVKGLNTAATLWCTAAVGVLVSTGFILEGTIGALTIVAANVVLRPISRRMYDIKAKEEDEEVEYEINIKCSEEQEFYIRTTLMNIISKEKMLLKNLESKDMDIPEKVRVKANVLLRDKNDESIERIVNKISLEQGVIGAGWKASE